MVWVLGALVLMATIDRVPDPPAANPNGTQFSVSSMVEHGGVTLARVTPASTAPAPAMEVAGIETVDLLPQSYLTVRMGQAADPSPPAFHVQL